MIEINTRDQSDFSKSSALEYSFLQEFLEKNCGLVKLDGIVEINDKTDIIMFERYRR